MMIGCSSTRSALSENVPRVITWESIYAGNAGGKLAAASRKMPVLGRRRCHGLPITDPSAPPHTHKKMVSQHLDQNSRTLLKKVLMGQIYERPDFLKRIRSSPEDELIRLVLNISGTRSSQAQSPGCRALSTNRKIEHC